MGVRFYRRIRICKGIHLNVSKSGVGISLGMRGASISTGPRGQYVNLGIPGTGIAYRQKIGGNSSSNNSQEKYLSDSDVQRRSYIENSNLKIQIDNDGKELVYMEAPDGRAFVDEEMMRRVKRSEMYREMLEITRKTKYDYMKQKNESCVEIYKAAPKLITEEDVITERDTPPDFKQNFYVIHEFEEPRPLETPFYDKAHSWAVQNVNAHFWNKKKKISEATQAKMQELLDEANADWEKRREDYIAQERKVKEEKDKEFEDDYKQRLAERDKVYEQILNPSDDYLVDTVKDVLSQIELPVDFSIDYAVNNREIELDIDLPEIEDFPQKTCSILSSGKLSIKNKSIAELNKDYATGVTGMAFYFASVLYNISPKIDKISISGYTQRISKKTGNEEDQYVYSVVFTREKFAELNIQNIDPIQAISNFDCTMDITSKYELKTIEVKESANRKTNADEQENQTEYYTVESVSKEPETIVIEKQLKTAPANNYSNSNSSSYSSSNNYTTSNNSEEQKTNKGCIGCLTVIIVLFCLFCLWLCSIPKDPNPHHPYRGSQINTTEKIG